MLRFIADDFASHCIELIILVKNCLESWSSNKVLRTPFGDIMTDCSQFKGLGERVKDY